MIRDHFCEGMSCKAQLPPVAAQFTGLIRATLNHSGATASVAREGLA